jgi:WD40 repeat protein
MWQHPFVNIFKTIRIGHENDDNKRLKKEGEVSYTLDDAVRMWALKIKGYVSAKNYVTIPARTSESLDLHGRFMYIQLRAEPPKVFVVHISVNTTKRTVVRFSFSNMHKEHKIKGNAVEIPCLLTQKWTVLSIDLPELLSKYGADGYDEGTFLSLKSVQMCSTINVRNIFTSDTVYRPDDLPLEMGLKLPKGVSWSSRYRWTWVPAPPAPPAPGEESVLRENVPRPAAQAKRPAAGSPPSQKRHFSSNSILREEISSDSTALTSAKAALGRAADLLEREGKGVGAARAPAAPAYSPPKPPTMEEMTEALTRELADDREKTLEFAANTMVRAGLDVSSVAIADDTATTAANDTRGEMAFASLLETSKRYPTPEFTLRPDPIMNLEAVVGYRGAHPNTLLWTTDGRMCVFPSNTCIVMMSHETPQGKDKDAASAPAKGLRVEQSQQVSGNTAGTKPTQHLLFGHTESVCAIDMTRSGALIASGQEGKFPMIRIWRVQQSAAGRPLGARCAAILSAHASDLSGLTFSPDDQLLCAVGKDAHHRVQIIVWNVNRAFVVNAGKDAGGAPYPIIAKQISEFDVKRIKFSPYEDGNLVSCGRENIRFWRIKRGHLRGCPVRLNEYARGTKFTDLAFESAYGPAPSEGTAQKRVFVSTAEGTVVQVNYATKAMECVYRLHDSAIHTIAVNEGFCVTGSQDKFLRVWPLDFSDYFLEAEHEGPVQAVDVSPDGLKLAVGTSSGTLGVLDISSHAYHTLLRSHTETVYGCALDPNPARNEFGTVSADGTIRIWSLTTLEQLYEFDAPEETARCIAYQPNPRGPNLPSSSDDDDDDVDDVHRIACGFNSGCVRIFDVPTTTMPHEHQQHRGPVVQVLFDPSRGDRLYSAGLDGHICVYDVTRGYQPVKMIASDSPARHVAMAISHDGALLAALGPDPACAIIFSAESLMPLRKLRRRQRNGAVAKLADGGGAPTPGARSTDSNFRVFCFNKDATELIAATSDRRLARYDVGTGTLIRETTAVHHGSINTLDVSPSGAYVISAGDDRVLRVWDAQLRGPNPPPFQSYIGHASGITQLKFSGLKDGAVNVVSVGAGNGVFLWKFYGVEEFLAGDDGDEEEAAEPSGLGSASETYRQHRTKRIASSPVARAEKAATVALDTEPPAPPANVLGEDAPARMFQSALAQVVSTVQRRGQMISKFIAKLANIFSDIDSVNDGSISTGELSETLRIMKVGLGPAQATAVIWELDPADSGRVDYMEFVRHLRAMATVQARDRAQFSRLVRDAGAMAVEALQAGQPRDQPLLRSPARSPEKGPGAAAAGGSAPRSTSLASVAAALGVDDSSSGVALDSILGYVGGGMVASSQNVLWHPDTGLFGYVTGQTVVLDDLNESAPQPDEASTASAASSEKHKAGGHHHRQGQTILKGPRREIGLTALSPDGRFVAGAEVVDSGTSAGTIYLWDSHGTLLGALPHQQGSLQALAFDGSSRSLVSAGNYLASTVTVWDVPSGTPVCEYTLPPGSAPIDAAATLPAPRPNTLRFLTCGRRTIMEWTMVDSPAYGLTVFNSIELPGSNKAFPEYLTAVDSRPSAHHQNERLIVAGGSGGTVWLFRAAENLDDVGSTLKFKLDGRFQGLDGGIEHIQWRMNVSAIVVAGVSNKVKLIGLGMDATSSPKTLSTTVVDGSVKSMTWESSLKDGIVGTDAGSVWYLSNSHGATTSTTLSRSHISTVRDVAASSDGALVASAGGLDATVRVWHAEAMQDILTLEVPPGSGECTAVAFPAAGGARLLAAGYGNGTVRQFDMDSVAPAGKGSLDPCTSDSTPVSVTRAHPSAVSACAYVAGPGDDAAAGEFLLVTGSASGELSVHQGGVANAGELKLKSDAETGSAQLLSPHAGHPIVSIQASPFDGSMFLCSSRNGCISVWKTGASLGACEQLSCGVVDTTSEEEAEMEKLGEGKPKATTMACFSPCDSDILLCTAGSGDTCQVVFWQFASSQVIRTLDLPTLAWPTSLCSAAHPNGNPFVAVGTRGGSLLYMDYHNGEPVKVSDDDDTRVHGDQVSAVGFNAKGNRLITAAGTNLHFWKFESGGGKA